MKNRWLSAVMIGLVAALSAALARGEVEPPPEGGRLPEFSLSAPKDAEEQIYLGVKGKTLFKPADVKAEVLIIEIFNMY